MIYQAVASIWRIVFCMKQASQLSVAWTVKGSSVPARNRLKTLLMFWPKSTGLSQGEYGNWSRTCSTYGYTWLLLSPQFTRGRCHQKLRNVTVWSWFPTSSGQPSSIQWPCGYWGLPWVVVLQGLWPFPPLQPLLFDGVVILPSLFLLLLTSPVSFSGRHRSVPSV